MISLMILLLKKLRQPYLIGYSLAGILIGPFTLGVIQNQQAIESVGEVGVLLYMFFLGMELKWPRDLKPMWKPILFQLLKIISSLLIVFTGMYLAELDFNTSMVLALILMLNNTSVLMEYLKNNNAHNSQFGVLILSVLVIQDISFAPILSVIQFLDAPAVSVERTVAISISTVLVTILIFRVNKLEQIKIPLGNYLKNDHDAQLFIGLTVCFSLATLTGALGLSTSLGAFAAGIVIKKIQALDWIEHALRPFKTFFMAMFFVYLGLIFDINFFRENIQLILSLVGFVVIVQNILSAIIFKVLGYDWRVSIYAGALLSNIGELSMVIALLAHEMKLIDDNVLRIVISTAILSILFTSFWTAVIKKFLYKNPFRAKAKAASQLVNT
jgi:monovalent cation:H+ antiporter-2, CPA2 family